MDESTKKRVNRMILLGILVTGILVFVLGRLNHSEEPLLRDAVGALAVAILLFLLFRILVYRIDTSAKRWKKYDEELDKLLKSGQYTVDIEVARIIITDSSGREFWFTPRDYWIRGKIPRDPNPPL